MITTVTLNPMLDKTIYVATIKHGAIERATRLNMVVGGKGINVSRQLLRLGCATVATGFFGGEIGMLLERLLDGEGIPHDFVRIAALTREGLTFVDGGGVQTSVFEPSAPVTENEADELVRRTLALAQKSTWLVCSGSSPSPTADGVFGRIIAGTAGTGVSTVVDSYGAALRLAAGVSPTLVKMNRDEYRMTFGSSLRDEPETIDALRRFIAGGSRWAVITDGPRPVYAASSESFWRITPPPVDAVNSTGSGDAMVAGILWSLSEGWPVERCFAYGAAAGAVNASRWEVAAASRRDVDAMFDSMNIERL